MLALERVRQTEQCRQELAMERIDAVDTAAYRSLMRHQAGAVAVIAAGAAGARVGLTATAVCSLSDSPPTLLVCVNRSASAHDVIHAERAFSVNLLASDQEAIAQMFSGRTGLKGEARFQGADWMTLATGAPVLDGALASLDCRLVEQHAFETHSIFIGSVQAGSLRQAGRPLLYFRGDYWDLAAG